MAANCKSLVYAALTKTLPRVKINDIPNLRVPGALRPISELKMAVDFENMGMKPYQRPFLG